MPAIRTDGRQAINDRGLIYPVLGLLLASTVVLGYGALADESLPPVSVLSIVLIGIGSGLVIARIGNLGPYDGVFGPPWFENRLRDLLLREAARSIRFGRQLTIVAAREPKSRNRIEWDRHLRMCDLAISCRDGWTIVIFPETDEAETVVALQRVRLEANHGFEAVLVSAVPGMTRPEGLADELHKLVAVAQAPDTVTLWREGKPDQQSLIP